MVGPLGKMARQPGLDIKHRLSKADPHPCPFSHRTPPDREKGTHSETVSLLLFFRFEGRAHGLAGLGCFNHSNGACTPDPAPGPHRSRSPNSLILFVP
jgi:hypothetical protein